MATSQRKSTSRSKVPVITVKCPSCGRSGRTAKTGGKIRCSECGKEFRAGDGGIVRTLVLIIVALAVIGGISYFAVTRASRLDAEEKAKAAIEERQRQAAEHK